MRRRVTTAALLAFDTATERMSVALEVDGVVWQIEDVGGARASASLIPAIRLLMAQAGIGWARLDAIAFGRGPGAFTGLRTACSVAQGLAFGTGKRVLPIDTLLVVAEDARSALGAPSVDAGRVRPPLRVTVAMDARMSEIYAAEYEFTDAGWTVAVAPMLTGPAALNAAWRVRRPDLIAGNALAVFGTELDIGDIPLAPAAMPRAVAMLPLARAALARGEAVDPAQALPFYVRDKVAQTSHERESARLAKMAAEAAS